MSASSALGHLSVSVEDLWRSTSALGPDANLLYRLLIELHWMRRGVLPPDPAELQQIARLDSWSAERFRAAFDALQADEERVRQDRYGLYIARDREEMEHRYRQTIKGQRGSLKQWGCRACRSRGKPIDLGDGWVRACSGCGQDLWADFEELPWLPGLVPTLPGKSRTPEENEEWQRIESQNSVAQYTMAIEAAALDILSNSRHFTVEEQELIAELFREGVPAEAVVWTMRDVAKRFADRHGGEKIHSIKYFLTGRNGGAIRENCKLMAKVRETPTVPVVPTPSKEPDALVASEEWDRILEALSEVVSREDCRVWFKPLRVISSRGQNGSTVLSIEVPNETFLGILKEDFATAMDQVRGETRIELTTRGRPL